MEANFKIQNSRITNFDKLIVVYNFNGLNEVFNQGFCYAKNKIKRKSDIVGAWKLKLKN